MDPRPRRGHCYSPGVTAVCYTTFCYRNFRGFAYCYSYKILISRFFELLLLQIPGFWADRQRCYSYSACYNFYVFSLVTRKTSCYRGLWLSLTVSIIQLGCMCIYVCCTMFSASWIYISIYFSFFFSFYTSFFFSQWPTLEAVARFYAVIPASAVCTERLNSRDRLIGTHLRQSLTPENLEQLTVASGMWAKVLEELTAGDDRDVNRTGYEQRTMFDYYAGPGACLRGSERLAMLTTKRTRGSRRE